MKPGHIIAMDRRSLIRYGVVLGIPARWWMWIAPKWFLRRRIKRMLTWMAWSR